MHALLRAEALVNIGEAGAFAHYIVPPLTRPVATPVDVIAAQVIQRAPGMPPNIAWWSAWAQWASACGRELGRQARALVAAP